MGARRGFFDFVARIWARISTKNGADFVAETGVDLAWIF